MASTLPSLRRAVTSRALGFRRLSATRVAGKEEEEDDEEPQDEDDDGNRVETSLKTLFFFIFFLALSSFSSTVIGFESSSSLEPVDKGGGEGSWTVEFGMESTALDWQGC